MEQCLQNEEAGVARQSRGLGVDFRPREKYPHTLDSEQTTNFGGRAKASLIYTAWECGKVQGNGARPIESRGWPCGMLGRSPDSGGITMARGAKAL